MSKPKIIGAMNVGWSVEWMLTESLRSLSETVDEVVIVAGNLSEEAVKIIKAIPNMAALEVKERERFRSEVRDFNRLIELARKRGGDWILFVDFDEVFEPKMKWRVREMVEAGGDVGMYRFKKIWLWRSRDYWRADRPEKYAAYNPNSILVEITPDLRWPHPSGALWKRIIKYMLRRERAYPQFGRGKIQGVKGRVVDTDIFLLHYTAVDWEHFVKKQMRYLYYEAKVRRGRSVDELVDWAYSTMDEKGLVLKPVEPSWFREG